LAARRIGHVRILLSIRLEIRVPSDLPWSREGFVLNGVFDVLDVNAPLLEPIWIRPREHSFREHRPGRCFLFVCWTVFLRATKLTPRAYRLHRALIEVLFNAPDATLGRVLPMNQNRLKLSFIALAGVLALTACPSPTMPTPPAPPPPPSPPASPPVTPPAPPPATVTVSGTVFGIDNQPAAQSSVLVSGAVIVQTKSDGTFSVPDVKAPYDLTVVNLEKSRVLVYKGLTATTLQIYPYDWSSSGSNTPVSGLITGGSNLPTPANVRTTAILYDPAQQTSFSGMVDANNRYTFGGFESTPSSKTVNVHAFQFEVDAAGLPTRFTGFGERLGLNFTNPSVDTNIHLGPVENATLSGSASGPAGYTLFKQVRIKFASGGGWNTPSDPSSSTSTLVVPNIPTTTLIFRAIASKPGTYSQTSLRGVQPNTTGINLIVPEPPTVTAPASAAVGVDLSTAFTWDSVIGGVQVLSVSPQGVVPSVSNPEYVIVTNEKSATLPDLSSFGISFPSAKKYSWSVYSDSSYKDANAYATSPFGTPPLLPGLTTLSSFGYTVSQTFTTAP
jgi:hypothetical protein